MRFAKLCWIGKENEVAKWRKWSKHKPLTNEAYKETCAIMKECLPKIIKRHEIENGMNKKTKQC